MVINILIIEHSKSMRFNIEQLISDVPGFQVMATTGNGEDAVEFLKSNTPDVILLDFLSPKSDGLATLEIIMSLEEPIPTILTISSGKEENSDLYDEALNLGALDIVSKPSGRKSLYIESNEDILINKINLAANSQHKLKRLIHEKKIHSFSPSRNEVKKTISQPTISNKTNQVHQESSEVEKVKFSENQKTVQKEYIEPQKIIFIGASTGGPPEIIKLLTKIRFHRDIAIIVIQHMPGGFTGGFTQRIDKISPYSFVEISNLISLEGGKGYCAKGGVHMKIKKLDGKLLFALTRDPSVWGIRPAIDYTLRYFAPIVKSKLIVIILTGMGQDGSKELGLVKKYGGTVIVQDPEDALIDSMPNHAIDSGYVDNILAVSEMATYINQIMV